MEISLEYKILFLTLLGICGILYLTIRYKLSICRIDGNSMSPTLKHGDWVYVMKDFELEKNRIYAFTDPEGTKCVKRLIFILIEPTNGNFLLFFRGDNEKESFDSRHYGYIRPSNVIGEVEKIGRN